MNFRFRSDDTEALRAAECLFAASPLAARHRAEGQIAGAVAQAAARAIAAAEAWAAAEEQARATADARTAAASADEQAAAVAAVSVGSGQSEQPQSGTPAAAVRVQRAESAATSIIQGQIDGTRSSEVLKFIQGQDPLLGLSEVRVQQVVQAERTDARTSTQSANKALQVLAKRSHSIQEFSNQQFMELYREQNGKEPTDEEVTAWLEHSLAMPRRLMPRPCLTSTRAWCRSSSGS